MKNIYLIVIMVFSLNAFSQSQIDFVLENGQLKIEGDTTNLTLPLSFRFKESDFINKEIVFKRPDTKTKISGAEKRFGAQVTIGPQDLGKYKIELSINKEDGKVQANPFTDFNCPDNSVIVELLGSQFLLRYKSKEVKGKDPEVKDNDSDEKEYAAGYILYDALALVSDTISAQTKLEILISYGYNGSENNLYLKKLYNDAESEATKEAFQQVSPTGSPFLTNLGNTDVTNFAAGLARFLAERTKEELNEAFFNKMKEQLNAYPELKTVFPQTALFLNIIETYSYASVIQVLKEAFETDIQNLPENLYNIKNLDASYCSEIEKVKQKDNCEARMAKLNDFFEKSIEGQWIGLGMFTVKEAIQSTNPADLLKAITKSTEICSFKKFSKNNSKYNDYNIASTIELSNVISQSLVSQDVKQVWISSSQLNSLFNTKDAFKIYLGLLLAKERISDSVVEFYNSSNELVSFGKILSDNYETYSQFESLIRNTYSAYNATNNAVKKMITASDKSVEADAQALYDFYRTITSSLKPIAHNQFLIEFVGKDIGAAYDKVEKFLNPSVDIAYHISTKKYSAAVYDASILLSAINEYEITLDGKTKKYDGFKPVTQSFVKYGTLISTVANAQSSEEVKKAIEASVLPVGSSAIKRNSNGSISINAYVGGFYGKAYSHEWQYKYDSLMNPIDSSKIKRNYQTYGLYAPIGISFNKGSKSGWGLSLTAQLIDLGALVNFYLTEGDQTALPTDFKIRLSNIFAPGAQLGINIPNMPLTITGGFQYVPALYETNQIESSSVIVTSNAWRWSVGLVVDIPMYNIKVWDFNK